MDALAKNVVHAFPSRHAEDRFDVHVLPIGGLEMVSRSDLSLRAVVSILIAAPAMAQIRFFDSAGAECHPPPGLASEVKRLGRSLVEETRCGTCGGTGALTSVPCPDCAVRWNPWA